MNSIDNFDRLRAKSPLVIEPSSQGKNIKKIKVLPAKLTKDNHPDLKESVIEKLKKQDTYIKQLEAKLATTSIS